MDNIAYDDTNKNWTEENVPKTGIKQNDRITNAISFPRKVSFATARRTATSNGSGATAVPKEPPPAPKLSQMYHEPLTSLAPLSGYNAKTLIDGVDNTILVSPPSAAVAKARYISFTDDTFDDGDVQPVSDEEDDATVTQSGNYTTKLRRLVDAHSPRALFVELLELCDSGDDSVEDGRIFRETARWIKFEEDVQVDAGRWSKPHAASLSFHSLTNLRRCLERAVLVLNYRGNNAGAVGDFGQLARDIVDVCGDHFNINALQMLTLKKCLLKRRQHFIENTYVDYNASLDNAGRTFSVSRMLASTRRSTFGQSPSVAERKLSTVFRDRLQSSAKQQFGDTLPPLGSSYADMVGNDKWTSASDAVQKTISRDVAASAAYLAADYSNVVVNTDYLKYLPSAHAEAAVVLAGYHESFEQIVVVFVRLDEALHMPGLVEVPVPIRFVLIIIGPPQESMSYHQVARCWATLMANAQFQAACYSCTDTSDIIMAMDKFLDFSVVLPPDRLDDSLQALTNDDAWNFQQSRWRKNLAKKRFSYSLSIPESLQPEVLASMKTEKTGVEFVQTSINGGQFPVLPSKIAQKSRKVSPVDNLMHSSRLFNGLSDDIRRRYPWYLRDCLDGLNFTCLSSIFFMFFAALTIATSLGALMSTKTGGLIGIEEVLVSTSLCGILFALFSCQPILMLAMTGPFMVFEGALHGFCAGFDNVDYLSFRFWIAIWVVFYVVLLLCFDVVGCMVRFAFKRFVEDIWTALLALIYIYESLSRVAEMFVVNPVLNKSMYVNTWNKTLAMYGPLKSAMALLSGDFNDLFTVRMNDMILHAEPKPNFSLTNKNSLRIAASSSPSYFLEPNTALLSLFILVGTCALALFLKKVRNSHYFGKMGRRCLSDYGVPISIFLFSLLTFVVPHVFVEKISLPDGMLQVTSPQLRGWFIHPFYSQKGLPLPVWSFFAAALPAVLVLILMFLLIEVGELIVCKKERQLKRGSGHHMDLLLAALLYIPCALLGLPWMTCTVVASVAHVNSVSVFEKTGKAPGDKPLFVEVKEQRVTAFTVSILIGVVMLFGRNILMLIPVSCLYGVFIYLGINSLSHLQFTKRLFLFLTPRKHHPSVDYVTKVRQWRMHLFTAVQLASLVILMVITESKISLFLPLAIVVLIPIRYAFTLVYPKSELEALDFDDRKTPEPEKVLATEDFSARPAISNGGTMLSGPVSDYYATDVLANVADEDFFEEARAPG